MNKFINKFDKIQPSFDDYNDDLLDVLSYIRISPGKNKTFFKKISRIIITPFCFICMYIHVLTLIIGFNGIDDLPSFSNRVSVFSLFSLGTIKWNHYILNFEKVESVIQSLRISHELCQKISNIDIGFKNYHEKLMDARKKTFILLFVWCAMAEGGLVQWCVNSYIRDKMNIKKNNAINENSSIPRVLPGEAWYPFEISSDEIYLSVVFFQFGCAFFTIILFASCDAMSQSFLIYLCAQIDYLNETLTDEKSIQLILQSKNPGYKYREKIKNCISLHTQILRVYKLYEDMASLPGFFQCINNVIGLCLVSLTASVLEINMSYDFFFDFMCLFGFGMGHAFECGLYCYYGSKLEYMGSKIYKSFFSSNWEKIIIFEDENIRFDSLNILKFAIMRSQDPMILTAGPFYVLNLPTFKALISMSISNALILRQFYLLLFNIISTCVVFNILLFDSKINLIYLMFS